jgi:spore germination cell wall hydrolase CwlJ-like protein
MVEQQPENTLFTICLCAEARGETNFYKLAVAWTIKNIARRYGTSIRDTILKPRRFSSFNHDDPNQPKLLILYKLEPEAWAACETIVDVLQFTTDPTGGSDHYYVFDGPGKVAPPWGRGNANWKERLVVGNTAFGACP